MKKIPMRKCIATNESLPKKELLRIVRTPEMEVKVDPSGKLNGKGAYIKKDLTVIPILKKRNLLKRTLNLDTEISDEIYLEIERVINEG
ncbi:MAG: YlxR family protein [Erysipelotrichaceae bacterium]|nr:YlxR family protein [Erysipelotrichaceae bacterium]